MPRKTPSELTEVTYKKLKTYLQKGDIPAIAEKHNVSRVQVWRVAKGISNNDLILYSLKEAAAAGKKLREEINSL